MRVGRFQTGKRIVRRPPRLLPALAATALLVGWGLGTAGAQPAPRLGYVYPAGGQAGTTLEVTIGGRGLQEMNRAIFSSPHVTAEVLEYRHPMSIRQFNALREELQQLQAKRQAWLRAGRPRGGAPQATNTWTETDARRFRQILDEIRRNAPNRNATPALAETVTLRVSIERSAPTGEVELRLAGPRAISNPLTFCIGPWPERSRPPARPPNPELERFLARWRDLNTEATADPDTIHVVPPVVLNGQILPGTRHRYQFPARRGQRMIAALQARALIPYLADTVPGWFQAVLTLYDSRGREIAANDDFRFHPDPLLSCEIPEDGEYVLEVRDALFRGREDFVYRLTLGELPRVTDVFPLGGRQGETTEVELTGWNLPSTRWNVDNTTAAPGVRQIHFSDGSNHWGSTWFAVDSLPEIPEPEPNDTPAEAPLLSPPVIVNGRILAPGEADLFRFRGRAGEVRVVEVMARRLHSPLDGRLEWLDNQRRVLATADDAPDPAFGLITHQADPYLVITLPADGEYFLRLTDAQGKGSPAHAYRLRLSPPRPDFELRLLPSALGARPGGTVTAAVHVIRREGFNHAIQLVLRGGPPGLALHNAQIPEGATQAWIHLQVPATAVPGVHRLELEGRARANEQTWVRPVVPADEWMQAFFYRHWVPARQLYLQVTDRPGRRIAPAGLR